MHQRIRPGLRALVSMGTALSLIITPLSGISLSAAAASYASPQEISQDLDVGCGTVSGGKATLPPEAPPTSAKVGAAFTHPADHLGLLAALRSAQSGTSGGPRIVALLNEPQNVVSDAAVGESMNASVETTFTPTPSNITAATVTSATDTGLLPSPTPSSTASSPSSAATSSAAPMTSPIPSATPTVPPVNAPLLGPGQLIVPLPSASPQLTPPPIPTPSPATQQTSAPVFITRGTPQPKATTSVMGPPVVSPTPTATLAPNQVAILADDLQGSPRLDQPSDASGNVHVLYQDGMIVGDHAHYDGQGTITIFGNAYLQDRENDSRLSADEIMYNVNSRHATLINGKGETSRGVEQGLLHYSARTLTSDEHNKVHGNDANFSTCENPRGGYHIHAKTIDVTPGQKLIARHAIVFLGGIAIFYLPVLAIPLSRSVNERHPVLFAPELGYDQVDGFYVRARLGFGTTNNYYGYYRVEEYTRRGLGLGYVAFIGKRNGKRQTNIDVYHFDARSGSETGSGSSDNLSLQDTENFSQRTHGQITATYTGDYGPYLSAAPSYSISGTITHATTKSSQNYTFSRTATGNQEETINASLQDSYALSRVTSQAFNLTYTDNTNSYVGASTSTSTIHINTLTHTTSKIADYTMTYDQQDSPTPSNYNSIPEFTIHPHGGHSAIPIDTMLTVGRYTEPSDLLSDTPPSYGPRIADRAKLDFNVGPGLFKVLHTSDLSATFGATQYVYSTGDLKAQTRQNLNLTTPFGPHFSNALTYQEQNLAGPEASPYQYLDVLGGATHNAQDVFRITNGEVYSLALSTGTAFDHQAQPIAYELTSHPSPRSTLIVGGSYQPGFGNGFDQTNVQIATPFGHDQQIEFTTNVDWKSRGRLRDKNIYFRKVVGNCYDILVSYNEDLQSVNVTLDLLSFPNHPANFGFAGQQQAVFPQNFVVP